MVLSYLLDATRSSHDIGGLALERTDYRAVSDDELVSMDFRGNPNSSIVDAPYTKVMDGDFLKVLSWYDNEWGYATRCVDLLRRVVTKGIS